jgi:MFS transporter, SP family, general alpha glucoside:H+ symporter
MFQGLTTAYASEVAPVVLRESLVGRMNCSSALMMHSRPILNFLYQSLVRIISGQKILQVPDVDCSWVFGHFLGAGILRALLERTDKWGYKIPFALQWLWPPLLFFGIMFAPQSPWWLVRKGRLQDANASLRRLTANADDRTLKDNLELMIRTNEIEEELRTGTSFLDCFRGVDLRRTEIVVMAYLIQYLHGNGLAGYSTYFFEQAGLSPTKAFDLTMGQYAIGFVGTLCSWTLMSRFGRRTLYLTGMVLSCMLLFVIGFVSLAPQQDTQADWATGALLLIFFSIHSTFIGPVLYAIVGEIPSTRLRQKSIVIAASAWSIMGIVNSSLTPYMLNPTAWNWRGKAGFFWGSFSILSTVWTYYRLPEAKGRTYAELDILFGNGISARRFKSTQVDVAEGTLI